jgi:hypothetical protein
MASLLLADWSLGSGRFSSSSFDLDDLLDLRDFFLLPYSMSDWDSSLSESSNARTCFFIFSFLAFWASAGAGRGIGAFTRTPESASGNRLWMPALI